MNKKQAKNQAYHNLLTYGELLKMVGTTRGKRKISKVNKGLTLDMALDIFENMLKGSIESKGRNANPKTTTWSVRRNCTTLSAEGLGIMNILRECG